MVSTLSKEHVHCSSRRFLLLFLKILLLLGICILIHYYGTLLEPNYAFDASFIEETVTVVMISAQGSMQRQGAVAVRSFVLRFVAVLNLLDVLSC